jgi:hypothetical protein
MAFRQSRPTRSASSGPSSPARCGLSFAESVQGTQSLDHRGPRQGQLAGQHRQGWLGQGPRRPAQAEQGACPAKQDAARAQVAEQPPSPRLVGSAPTRTDVEWLPCRRRPRPRRTAIPGRGRRAPGRNSLRACGARHGGVRPLRATFSSARSCAGTCSAPFTGYGPP